MKFDTFFVERIYLLFGFLIHYFGWDKGATTAGQPSLSRFRRVCDDIRPLIEHVALMNGG